MPNLRVGNAAPVKGSLSPSQGESWYLDGQQTIRRPHSRWMALTSNASLSTGVMTSCAVVLYAGDVITNISVRSGSTGATTPTNYWFALYDTQATPALLSQTADQTSTAWASSTSKTIALQTPQTITTTGVYYVGVMMAAATPVNLLGVAIGSSIISSGIVASQKNLCVTSGSSLTSTAPATITGAAVASVPFYFELS